LSNVKELIRRENAHGHIQAVNSALLHGEIDIRHQAWLPGLPEQRYIFDGSHRMLYLQPFEVVHGANRSFLMYGIQKVSLSARRGFGF